MMKLTSFQWWIETFVQTLICMVFIYMIKTVANQFNVPVVKDIANNI